MQSFEVEILEPKAENLLYDLQRMKLIRLKKKPAKRKNTKALRKPLLSQIEKGLKDVSALQSGKLKKKSLSDILNG
jgi:hypothetical protein